MGRSFRSVDGALEKKLALAILLLYHAVLATSETDPNDLQILREFKKGLRNPDLLKWPKNGADPCGNPLWRHVFCETNRVTQIQVRGLGLVGTLPHNFNNLTMLSNLGLQQNNFSGTIPSFSGLSQLRYAYLDFNQFDSLAPDFFHGLPNLEVLALDYNNLNAAAGWLFPMELRNSLQLRNLSMMNCNLVGPLPDFLGKMSSLAALKLSLNSITGEIPWSFADSALQILWLNDQSGGGMTGSIGVVASMVSLSSLWLHGNSFSGAIPANIGDLISLKDLDLNGNNLVGLIPDSLADMDLERLDLNNNHLMGSIPKFKAKNVSFVSNSFCQQTPGILCSPEVEALLGFLQRLNYPSKLVSSWSGNDPCQGLWIGLSCTNQKISMINLPNFGLSGMLSPSIINLASLVQIRVQDNNITGQIPNNFTRLKSLVLLDVRQNNISPPLPVFSVNVKFLFNGNPLLEENKSKPVSPVSPPRTKMSPPTPEMPPPWTKMSPPPIEMSRLPPETSPPLTEMSPPPPEMLPPPPEMSPPRLKTLSYHLPPGNPHVNPNSNSRFLNTVLPLCLVAAVIMFLVVLLSICYCKKKKKKKDKNGRRETIAPLVHPSESSNYTIKIAVPSKHNGIISSLIGSCSVSESSCGVESGNLLMSFPILRNVTKNFSVENELGRGGFGVVYKGELDDGTVIAVKRMEASIISAKAIGEFHAEITVFSKVRHRHLVSLLGYSVEHNEKLLVYEYMPQGALSKHLFHWKSFKLEPLSWKRRLSIALDVARGLEYLHSLAHQSFIHRDLKPSNILLANDFRAKVSDFGLAKLAPDGQRSLTTRLAGTFGYLAPEYAVMGKITTKTDVFSFGVVLMELLTGLAALDEERAEETQYLVGWFWSIKNEEKKLKAAIDSAIDAGEETLDSILVVAELAGHCTAREPTQRPDMGHVVSLLAPLVEKWKPSDDGDDEYSGIDYSLPLHQMVKRWQEAAEGGGDSVSSSGLQDSSGSIPIKPAGFADSFTSTDGR